MYPLGQSCGTHTRSGHQAVNTQLAGAQHVLRARRQHRNAQRNTAPASCRGCLAMLQAGGVGMLRLPRHSPVHGRVLQPALNAVRRRAALVPQRLKAAETADTPTTGGMTFSGKWLKDAEASDAMDAASQLMGLSMIMRQAVKLIKGVEVTHSDTHFTFGLFSLVTWFKITESYPLDGTATQQSRRDLRSGKHTGSASHAAADTLTIQLTWPEPYGGVGLDTWRLVGPDELHVTSSITVKGQTVQWRQVYKRSP